MKIFIVGEDEATRGIIKRILNFCSDEIDLLPPLPARGSEIKSNILKYNELAKIYPVILLMDLDENDCAPTILQRYFQKIKKETHFILNIAVDEAEAWLMADRDNFSEYFHLPVDLIPVPREFKNIKGTYIEMYFPYKSSFYMVREIIPHSKVKEFREQMIPKNGAKKGKNIIQH